MKKNTNEITEAELNELKEKANVILAFCRQQMLTKHPFTGNIAMNLNLKPVRDVRNPTACTDGGTIFFDIAFLADLNQEEREFVLAHEVWHNVMMHFSRREMRDPQLFNIATDMEVNQLLAADGFTAPDSLVWPNSQGGHKSQFDFPNDLSAEEYYELLMKTAEKNDGRLGGSEERSSGQGQGGQRGKAKKLSGQFDKHIDPTEKMDEAAESEEADKYGKRGIDGDFTPKSCLSEAEKRQMAEKIRESIVSAAQTMERERGELPGFIKKIVDQLLTPKIPWKEVLAAFMTSTMVNKTDWNRPNRRFAYNNTYLPSHDGEALRIAVGIDTSGSCGHDFPKFLTEIASIAKTFDGYELHVIQCDTEVKDCTVYDESNPIDDSVIEKFEFKGLGGTELHPVFDYINENDIDVDAVVFFTDGECEEITEDMMPSVPVIWCITGCKDAERFTNLHAGQKLALDEAE